MAYMAWTKSLIIRLLVILTVVGLRQMSFIDLFSFIIIGVFLALSQPLLVTSYYTLVDVLSITISSKFALISTEIWVCIRLLDRLVFIYFESAAAALTGSIIMRHVKSIFILMRANQDSTYFLLCLFDWLVLAVAVFLLVRTAAYIVS